MKFPKLDLRKKLNTVTDSEGNVFTAEKTVNGYIVNCKGYENRFCLTDDVKVIFEGFMSKDYRKEIDRILNKWVAVQAEPVQAEPKKDITMLTTNQILKTPPKFILSVNYDAGSLADKLGEYDRDDNSHNEYLAEMTIQYHTITCNACLSFTVECLVSVVDNKVTIEEMDTSDDMLSVYSNNIKGLPNDTMQVWAHDLDDDLHTKLVELMESQPIDDIPEHFIIESY